MDGINALIARGVQAPQWNALDEQNKAVNALAAQQNLADMPQRRQLQAKELQIRELALDVQKRAMEAGDDGKPITIDYPEFSIEGPKAAVSQVAAMVAQYPDQTESPEFAPWLAQQGVSIKRPQAKAQQPSSIAKMLDDAGITDPAERQRYIKQALDKQTQWAPEKPGSSFEMTTPDGTTIRYGKDGRPNSPVMPATQTNLEKDLVATKEERVRLENIVKRFDTELPTFASKGKNIWLNIKEKAGGQLTEDDRQFVDQFSTFAQDTTENINMYIKRITGAQMSEAEADRLKMAMPDIGQGFFEGDGPTKFQSKLKNAMEKIKLAEARHQMYLAQGLSGAQIQGKLKTGKDLIGLDQIKTAIEARGKELKNKGMDAETIKQTLRQEFGL